ncbi:methyltransferase domain-containing protein [Pseudoduganella sp. LjRoot289]|uniref:GlcNAc-transferase family protein n=1 Tax=Pseudoduganella sp. LjRoot289 TaxID=3342314 RepID=UPI003ED09905
MQPTIFVSIASYRDPDCQNTVRDLFEKAAHPERVFIGICWQSVPLEDDDCFVLETRPEQVRTIRVHAADSKGACWARAQVQTLWQGEDYYLQVDSHMRFVAGWDDVLIAMLAQCDSARPLLSTYPLAFTPPDTYGADGVVTIHPKEFDETGVLAQRSEIASMKDAPPSPQRNAHIGAGLIFAAGRVVAEVPYDPYLYFEGEEITLAARLWTSGWDIFVPNAVVAYHDYGRRPERPRHWKDQSDWDVLNQHARKRVRHLLGIERSREGADLVDIERHGLGTVRSLAEYETYSGLDFRARLHRGRPLVKPELAAGHASQAAARQTVFGRIWRDNLWGGVESRSGGGSTLASTVALRGWLPQVLDFLGVRILADAGCGDVQWCKETAAGLRLYLGFDIVPELVAELRTRFKEQTHCLFSEADIVTATLPQADAVLCRDCLTHLPLDAVTMALERFRASGARYLIATTHAVGRNSWIPAGGWQALDLTAAPFNLPAPRMMLDEGGAKRMGVWAMADLPVRA